MSLVGCPSGSRSTIGNRVVERPRRFESCPHRMKLELTVKSLENLLKEAKEKHSEFEKKTGTPDKNWPRWYAEFIYRKLKKK